MGNKPVILLLLAALTASADTVLMKDGTRVSGAIVDKGDDVVVVDVPNQGKVTLATKDIDRILPDDPRPSNPMEPPLEPDAQTLARAGGILALLDKKPPAEMDDVAEQLVALGAPVVPCLPVLAKGRGRGPREDAATFALKWLSEKNVDPSRSLAAATGNQDAEVRATALRMLSRLGGPAALDTLLPMMSKADPAQAPMLDMSISAILSRSPARATYARVSDQIRALPAEAKPRLAQCIGAAGSPFGVAVLAQMLGADRALNLAVARALGHVPPRDDTGVADRLSTLLTDGDPAMRCACALALGRFHDVDALDRLVSLVDDPKEEVKGAVQEALCSISCNTSACERREWEAWFGAEMAWRSDSLPDAITRLKSGDPLKVIQAAEEAGGHPLSRVSLVPVLVELLRDPSNEVRTAVCNALARLGATDAVPSLIDGLDDGSEPVRTAAWGALKKITWLDLPPYSDKWKERWGER